MKIESKTAIGRFFLLNLIILLIPSCCFSQSAVIDCQATIRAWKSDPQMKAFMATHTCDCSNGNNAPPVWKENPIQGSGGGSVNSGGSQNIQMMRSILQPFFNNLFAPPDNSGRYEIEKQNAIERQQGEEKQKLAARQAWVDLQNTEASKRKMEDTQKQAAGQELLVKMGSVGGSLPTSELKFKTIGTDFFSTGKSSEIQFQPIGTDRYPTSDFSEAKRLLGSTYFLGNALDAARNGDYESARFFGEQADKVMTGQPTDVKCGFPAMPDVPEPSDPKKVDANKQKLANLLSNFKEDVKSLQDIEYKISESKEKIKNAELKKEEATTRVDELHNRAATAKPEEQAEVDDLAKQAQKQLQDAAKELDQAKQFQSDELAKKEKLENELDNMRTQQATMQAGDK